MKTTAKLIVLLITAIMLVSLVGCAQTPAATTEPTQAVVEPTKEQVKPTEPVVEPTKEEVKPTEPPAAEAVTLRYANWNLGTEEENNINRQLVKAYTDLHPNVTVEIVDMSAEGGWEANLTAYAAKGELPDVIMANNVPLYVQNGWVADVTEFVKDDADYAVVPQALRDAFTYNGKVLGLPFAQFLMGYFVNKDLFEAANLDPLEYGFTVDEFKEAVMALTDVQKAKLGADEWFPFLGWYPNTVDPNLKWYSYDGEKMNYNSAAFKEGVAFAEEMKPYTWQGLTEEQIKNFKSVGPWELFLNQEVGLKWDATWNVPGWTKDATFDWDFVGFPGGNQAIVFDAIVIGATTENVQEAYNFAKWMTFSQEAYAKEAELAKAMGTTPKIPVSMDDASMALYKTFVDRPGINAALDNLDGSVLESMPKVVPGYIKARWEGKPGIDVGDQKDVTIGWMFDNVTSGAFKYEDFSAKLEEFANKIMAEDAAAVNK